MFANERQSNGQFDRVSMNTTVLIQRRNNEQHGRDALRPDVISFVVETLQRVARKSVFEHDGSLSKTELRAAQPSVHRRCNRLLNAAARKVSAER